MHIGMKTIMLTSATLIVSGGLAYAGTNAGMTPHSAGALNHARLAQNDTGGGTNGGTVGQRPGGVNVPAAVGTSSGTGGADSGQMAKKGTTGTSTSTGASQSSKVTVPPTVGKSGGAGGANNGGSNSD